MCVPTSPDGMWHYLIDGFVQDTAINACVPISRPQPIRIAADLAEVQQRLAAATGRSVVIRGYTMMSAPDGNRT